MVDEAPFAPSTVREFLADPTDAQWESHKTWAGPDGASWCPDRLMGVRIGVVSPDYAYRTYPANMHDWRYRLGRVGDLPASWRKRADAQLKYDIRDHLYNNGIGGVAYAIGWVAAAAIYWVVRVMGWFAWYGDAE